MGDGGAHDKWIPNDNLRSMAQPKGGLGGGIRTTRVLFTTPAPIYYTVLLTGPTVMMRLM
jgi:hypothetical protein